MSSSGQIMSSSSGSSPEQTSSGISPSSQSFYSAPLSSADNSSTPPPATNTPTPTVETSSPTPTATTPSPTSTTPPSSPEQTSSAAALTTPSSSNVSTSTPSSSTATPTTTVQSSFTSEVETTFSSTDAAGSVVYVTSTVPQVITTAVSSSTGGSSSSSNNTAIIAGAVAGGVAVVAILALLIFCIRKRARKNEFDGNFDPDRVVGHTDIGGGTLPHVDLADEVSPFPQSYPDQNSSSMRQFGKSPYIPVPSPFAPSGHPSSEFYPHGAAGAGASNIDVQPRQFSQAGPAPPGVFIPPVNMYGTGPEDWHTPRPGVSPPPSTVSNTTSSARVTKEREAMARAGQGVGLGLATQQEVAEGSGDVVVHQDAGRAPVEEPAPPSEIPPAYDSIQRD